MKQIEINEIPTYLDETPLEVPSLFIGDTGIGKTQVIEEYAQKRGYHMETLILSQLRPDEGLGMPVKTTREYNGKEYPSATRAIPEWVFRLAEHEKAMIFIDELFTAKPDVMNSFLNFITTKKVEDIDLSHVKIVSATNIGIYTFEPDNNIISRFAKFYAVNTTYNKYIKDPRINNDYEDETNTDHVIFDEVSLKPRCQYWLSLINDDFLPAFYESFTNSPLGKEFSQNNKLNRFLNNIHREQGSENKYVVIDEANVGVFIQFIRQQFPRLKRSKNMLDKMSDVDFKIGNSRKEIEEFLDVRLQQ